MRNKLKDMMNSNTFVKIVSVCIAIILWLYVQSIQSPQKEYPIKNQTISLVNTSFLQERNLVVMDENEFKIDLMVNCSRADLLGIKKGDLVAYVDLSEVRTAGVVELPVKVRSENQNVYCTAKEPSVIKVNIDNVVTVQKDLKLHITGNLKDGFYTDDNLISAGVETVSVKGPKSIVGKIDNGIVAVNISNKGKSFNDICKVVLVDKEGTAVVDDRITVLNDDVPVDVTVLKTKVLPVIVAGMPEGVKYTVSPSVVEIAGPEDVIKNMESIEVNNFTLSSRNEGHTQDIDVKLEEGLLMLTDVVPQLKVGALE